MAKVGLVGSMVLDTGPAQPVLANKTILIENERIIDLLSPDAAETVDRVIDATGLYAMPGLVDACFDPVALPAGCNTAVRGDTLAHQVYHILQSGRQCLEGGLSVARSTGWDGGPERLSYLDIELRGLFSSGKVPGPRLLACGVPIPLAVLFSATDTSLSQNLPDQARRAARLLIKNGADHLRILAEGLDEREIREVVDQGQQANEPIAALAVSASAIENCIKAGIRWIELTPGIEADGFQRVCEQKVNLILAVPSDGERMWLAKDWLVDLKSAGMKIAVGSGNSSLSTRPQALLEMCALLVEAGFSPGEALKSVTIHGAECLQMYRDIGNLKAGRMADILLLDANPLTDIHNLGQVRGMIKAGQVVHWRGEPAASEAPAATEKVMRVAAPEPDSLDPTKGGYGYQEYQNLYEPLVDSYRTDGEITPLAAESYKVSDDGLTITFVLRPDLKWSDGQPLVAEDYRFAWLRQLNPETAAYAAEELFPIKNAVAYNSGTISDTAQVGIQATDEKTLVVTLEEPSPSFLRYVGDQNFFPVRKDILEKYGDKWMEAGNFVGNGPYMLQEWKHDQKMVFVKNPYYNGPWKDTRKVDRIEFTIMQDAWNQAVPGFEAGELDVAIVPSTEIDRVKADPKLGSKLQQLPISGSVIMIFDTKNKPTDNASIRLALSLAVDRQTLAEKVLKAAYAPAISLSPPDLASHNPDKAAGYAYDVAKAKQLLADAGYPDGKGFPAFELTFWSQEREGLIAQAIKAMWKENLGIDITLQTLEPKAMRDWRIARNEQPFNAYLGLNWSGISDPREFHNAILDPNNSLKRSRYDNQQYVDLIRNAVKELDPAKRAELYKQAEEIVNTDVPIISLIYEGRTWLVEPYVVNFAAVTTAVAEMIRYAAPPGLDTTR